VTETLVAKQVRLVLEQQCALAFKAIWEDRSAREHGLTLLLFDFGFDGDVHRNVAFKTSLFKDELIDSFEKLLGSWGGEPVREPVPGVNTADLNDYGKTVEGMLPAGVGFAILVGRRSATAYIASSARDCMIEMLERELLPTWKGTAP
jgi:hypothetical protein